MFKKIKKTSYPPQGRPILVWDGNCGFCKYWVTRWRGLTKEKVVYKTFQEAAQDFPDIPLKEFKKASRFIDTDGRIYSGPDSAYKSYSTGNMSPYLHKWYHQNGVFTKVSDTGYHYITKNRPFAFKCTQLLFGKDPKDPKPYWLMYTISAILIVFYLSKL